MQKPFQSIGRKRLLFLIIVVIGLYGLLPQLHGFNNYRSALASASVPYISLALLCSVLTYFFAAGTYYYLALQPLRYLLTVVIQFASMFANRLLPAGIGAIGVNYVYLRHNNHSRPQAVGVVTANSIVGLVGHFLLIGLIFTFFSTTISRFHFHVPPLEIKWILILVFVLLAIFIVIGKKYAVKIRQNFAHIKAILKLYKDNPSKIFRALGTSIFLTLSNALSLYFCANAFHLSLSISTILLIFTFGLLIGTATPTPGGIGGIEGGLIAGFIAFHISSTDALTIVLTYRFVSFWFMLIIGAGAFLFVERKQLIKL